MFIALLRVNAMGEVEELCLSAFSFLLSLQGGTTKSVECFYCLDELGFVVSSL